MNEANSVEYQDFIDKYVRKDTKSYRILKAILRPIAWLLYRPKIHGKENVPVTGPALIAGNHRFLADPAFICLSTDRVVHYLAKKELHDGKLGFFFRWAHTIPVDRSGKAHNSMEASKVLLNDGHLIGIFPEGTRNKVNKGGLLPFKFGAVKMAQDTGAPIVPVGMQGGEIPILKSVRVYIGEPYYIAKDADLEEENEKLRNKILELMKR